MSAARHFTAPGTLSKEELAAQIGADIGAAHGAARDLEAAGSHDLAAGMRGATDEYLDEYSDAAAGTWRPKHGS